MSRMQKCVNVGELKRLGDLEHEIPSQCVVDKIAKDSKPQVLSNLCLKIDLSPPRGGGTTS